MLQIILSAVTKWSQTDMNWHTMASASLCSRHRTTGECNQRISGWSFALLHFCCNLIWKLLIVFTEIQFYSVNCEAFVHQWNIFLKSSKVREILFNLNIQKRSKMFGIPRRTFKAATTWPLFRRRLWKQNVKSYILEFCRERERLEYESFQSSCCLKNKASNFSYSHTFRQNKKETNELYKQENGKRNLKIQQPFSLTFPS